MTSEARQTTTVRTTRIAVCGALAAGAMLVAASPAGADPGVSEPIADVASHRWDGTVTNAHLGEDALDNVGDVNGDGRDDVIASTDAPRDAINVLFSPPAPGGPNLDDLPPSEGYSILTEDTSPNAIGIGDQNGDDVPDILMVTDSGDEVAVVYGIPDPSGLPQCDPAGATRCLDLENATLTTEQGYYVVSADATMNNLDTSAAAADFNGDGVNDLAFGGGDGPEDRGVVYVLYGGREATVDPVELETAPGAEVLRIDGPAVDSQFGGNLISGLGDLNGDGRDEVGVESAPTGPAPGTFVIYGVESATSPMSTEGFGPAQGFRLAPAPGLSLLFPGEAGDVNGDGRPDLVVGSIGILLPPGRVSVLYGPQQTPAAPIPAHDPGPGEGYVLAEGEDALGFELFINPNQAPSGVGDLNGDGVPDFLVGDTGAPIGGNEIAGMASLMFGEHPAPAAPAVFDSTLAPDQGISLVGTAIEARVGGRTDSAGDVDGDGLPDFFVTAPGVEQNALAEAGSVYLVLGKDLVGEANTGQAGGVDTSSATLGGSGKPNGRPSVAYFEYGTTDEFGEITPDQDIGGGNATQSVDADADGLEPNTTYSYRLVVENDLGLKRYGGERTFTTDATPPPPGGGGGGGGAQAGLDVTANPPSKKAKANKKAKFTAEVRNAGGADAEGVEVCAESSKKGLKGGECQLVGSLAGNASAERSFSLKTKKKGKHDLTFTATAEDVSDATDTATLQVRKKKGKKK